MDTVGIAIKAIMVAATIAGIITVCGALYYGVVRDIIKKKGDN